MKIRIQDGLPYVTAVLTYQGQELMLENVIIDTGSAGTIFASDRVSSMGLLPEPHDPIRRIRGVGGTEFVFTKRIDTLMVGELQVDSFEIEVGAMAYGYDLEGIVGMDFLTRARAVIDLGRLELKASSRRKRHS